MVKRTVEELKERVHLEKWRYRLHHLFPGNRHEKIRQGDRQLTSNWFKNWPKEKEEK